MTTVTVTETNNTITIGDSTIVSVVENSVDVVTVGVAGADAPTITAKNEGSTLTSSMTSLDFVGAGVEATNTGGAVTVTISGGGAGLADGDKGDITVSGSGATWTIDNGVVTAAKTSAGVQASLALADSALQSAPVTSVNSLTGAVTLTTANVSDSINKRYVTDANLTVIGNTSGTNTGDQNLSGYATTVAVAAGYQPLATVLTNTTASFTTVDETKLDGIEAGAQVNTVTATSSTAFTNKSGNISQWTNDAGYITATLTDEQVQDKVGAMFTGNTETLITATYQDSDGTIDLVVDSNLANYNNATSGFITSSALSPYLTSATASSTYQPLATVLTNTTASFTTTLETKLNGIEASADVTDTANVTSAISGAALTAVTVAGTDKVLIQDVSDSDNLKTVTAQSIADLSPSLGDGDKGDITVSSSGTVWTIDNGAVTLAKQADMATASVVYRKTAGAGAPEVNTLATLKTDLGLTGTNSGDVTVSDSSEIDFTLTGQQISASLIAGSIDETKLDTSVNASLDLADTAVQPAALASYVPYSGATGNVNLGVHSLIAHSVIGDATDGLILEASNGTDIGILGAGNTANATWYGSHNYDTATASTIASFGASKTLSSLSTATYPDLTEISYVKGVTSAIQTQLNGKQASGSYITASSTDTLTNKDLTSGTNTFPTFNQNTTGSAASLTTTRTIWGQNFNGSANVTGTLTLGTADLTMTGSLAATGARVTKGWFTDIESTNAPTVGGSAASGTGGLARVGSPAFTGTITGAAGTFTGNWLAGCSGLPSSTVSGVALRNPQNIGPTLFSCGTVTTNDEQVSFVNGNGAVGGVTTNGSATSFNTSSDEAFKLNVRPIDDAGEIIDALELRKYEWNSYEGDTGYGVIAQDAYKIFPQAISVGTTDPEIHPFSDEYQKWGADYSKFMPLVLAELQYLRKRVKELESALPLVVQSVKISTT